MRLTENFSLDEFKSKDGSAFPAEVVQNLAILAEQLQALRDEVKKPITVLSGYRSPAHNLKIGGAKESFHVKGMASDLQVSGMKPAELAEVIEKLIKEGKMKQGGIGIYPTFVHYDFRNKKIRWKK